MFAKRKDVKIALPGLQSFSCCNGQLWYFTDEDGIFFLHLDGQDVRIAIAKQHNQIAHIDSGLIVVIFSDNTHSIYDGLSLDLIKDGTESSVKITLNHLRGNHFGSKFFAYTGSFPNQERGWVDISNDAIQCMSKDLFPWYFAGKEIIGKKNNNKTICLYRDCNELWHFDVTEPGRYREWYPEGPERPGVVTKFLGVWQRRLYVAVSNGLIIELELESGRLLRSWQQLPDGITLPPSGWDKLHGLELAFLDAAAGEIACVTHQYYWHIDLESGALHFHDLREHFSAAQLQVSPPAGDPAFDAEHIYFASEFHQYDGQSGANVYQLAALHRRSARIVWQQQVELPQSCQWKQHPVLDGRRLYALSHDLARSSEGGTLHIFERTE